MSISNLVGPMRSVSPGPDWRLLWGAVEEHEMIRRLDIPHKEFLSST